MSPNEPGGPGPAVQAATLRAGGLLTLPRLVDAATLYTPADLASARALCSRALALLPELGPAWEAALPDLAANLGGVRAGLASAAAGLRGGSGEATTAILPGLALLRDGAASLASAAAACPSPWAPALLAAGGGCVPALLAAVHDDLVPDLAASLGGAVAAGQAGAAEVRMLEREKAGREKKNFTHLIRAGNAATGRPLHRRRPPGPSVFFSRC